MRPLIDTRILVSQISHDQRSLQAIQQVGYVEDEMGGKKHAEIKISDYLYDNQDSIPNDKYYIGITKLTCGPCDIALQIFDKATDGKMKLSYAGTHGGTYPRWQMPKWLNTDTSAYEIFRTKLNEIKEMPKEDLSNKAPETVPLTKIDKNILFVQLPHEITAAEEKAKSATSSIASSIAAQPKKDTTITSGAIAGGDVGTRQLSWADRVRGNLPAAHTSTPGLSQRSVVDRAQAKTTHTGTGQAKSDKIVQYLKTTANEPSRAQARAVDGRIASPKGRGASGAGRG